MKLALGQNKMNLMERRQIISICLAVGCLSLGSTLYVLFRPTTLLMFHWAASLGLTRSIEIMRSWVDGFARYLPTWIVYSLPFTLWVLSYLFFVRAIWWSSATLDRQKWFWCIPVIAIAAELAQGMHIIQGYFDIVDLITIVVGTTIGSIVLALDKTSKGVSRSWNKT